MYSATRRTSVKGSVPQPAPTSLSHTSQPWQSALPVPPSTTMSVAFGHGTSYTTFHRTSTTLPSKQRCAQPLSLPPPKSTKPPRQPVTVDYLATILSHLNKNNPLDAAIAACLTT